MTDKPWETIYDRLPMLRGARTRRRRMLASLDLAEQETRSRLTSCLADLEEGLIGWEDPPAETAAQRFYEAWGYIPSGMDR